MYESFYSFQSRPFTAAPNARLYFPAGAIEHARETVIQGIERAGGAAVIVGPTGCGKSLLMHCLAEEFGGRLEIVMLASARLCTRRALLQNILFELNLPYRNMEEGELRLSLIDHLEPTNSPGMLVLVDEAHTLPMRLLEELRMITNLVRDGEARVGMVMAGTRQLEERLAHPKLDALNQRVAARCYLEPLSSEETRNMVRRQVEAVGGNPDAIFTWDALDAIHRASDGIPRLINQIADRALLMAATNKEPQINAARIQTAWADIQQLPTPWNTEERMEDETSTMIEFGALDDDDPTPILDAVEDDLTVEFVVGEDNLDVVESGQVELRVAPVSRDESTAEPPVDATEPVETTPAPLRRHQPEFELETEATSVIETASTTEATLADLYDLADLDEPVDVTPTETSSYQNSPFARLKESPPIEVMDDPFAESFDEEEVIIQADEHAAPAATVCNGPLSSELSRLLVDAMGAAPTAAITWAEPGEDPRRVEDMEATFESAEAAAEAEQQTDYFGEDAIVAAANPVDASGRFGDDIDAAQEPFVAISTEETAIIPNNELNIHVNITDDDIVDELNSGSLVAHSEQTDASESQEEELIVVDDDPLPIGRQESAPKAKVIRREYSQLFAQLRRD